MSFNISRFCIYLNIIMDATYEHLHISMIIILIQIDAYEYY